MSTKIVIGILSTSNLEMVVAPETPIRVRIKGPIQQSEATKAAKIPPPSSKPGLFSEFLIFTIMLPQLIKYRSQR